MAKKDKTNAMRLLEASKIPYERIDYPVDEKHLEATHVAEVLGENPEVVYKTIVVNAHSLGPWVCVVPANREIDFKKVAKLIGAKKVEGLPLKELEPLTGYIRGGCTAIGMKYKLPVLVSPDFIKKEYVYVSGGRRGIQIKLSPYDYMAITGALPGDILASLDKQE